MWCIRSITACAAAFGWLIALAGCGGDEGESSAAGTDEEAITETIRGWLTEGGCERMTDKFLEAQTFIDDPEQACETFEAGFTAPSYSADDVVVSEIEVQGDRATATVGDANTDITSEYTLVREDGQWKIDKAEL